MGKVLIISKKITSTGEILAKSLTEQQHEVHYLTSFNEIPTSQSSIQWMTFFKKWNWLETFKIMPVLLSLRPQIIHFILEDDELDSAHIILAGFAKSFPNCLLSTSLMNIKQGLKRNNPARYLLEESDMVTGSSIEILAHLRGLSIKNKKQIRGVLPPLNKPENMYSRSISELQPTTPFLSDKILEILEKKKFVLFPFFEPHFKPESTYFKCLDHLSDEYFVVLMGSTHWPARERKKFQEWMSHKGLDHNWCWTGDLNSIEKSKLLQECHFLFIAGLELSPMELSVYYNLALSYGATIVMDQHQSLVHAGLWKNEQNCWILQTKNFMGELENLLQIENLKLPLSPDADQKTRQDLVDAPLNELNRLYSRAFSQLKY